jgi:hypothetical protein
LLRRLQPFLPPPCSIELSRYIAKDSLDERIYFLKNEEIKEEFSAKGLAQAKSALDVLKIPEQERVECERYQGICIIGRAWSIHRTILARMKAG